MEGSGNDLDPCPFCGDPHPDTVLLCPKLEKLLPLQGRTLDGKFRFVRMLGEGGMGTVWEAENVFVKKRVAIKLMHVQFSKNEGVLARFRNEATAAGRIGSEHICDILDLGSSELGPYIVMEMLRGRDFAGFLQYRQGKVEPGLSVLILREALKGLSAAHHAGIIHRDLKPENIFLHEPKPNRLLVKLMDFGISKFTEGSEAGKTGLGVLMGTPEYMSPEQTEGAAKVDQRTDIWAMGVILYWALSGRNPFLGPTLAATLVNVSTREPPPLTPLGGHIDPRLVAIIAKSMRKDPAERWSSCDEFSAALAPFENRNNGIYVVAGGASPGVPRPGATVAAPSVATAVPLHSGRPSGPQPLTPVVSGPSPTFVGGMASATGNSPTWSNEFRGAKAAHPTMGGNDRFHLSDDQLEQRPDSSLGRGGSKGGMVLLITLLIAAAATGVWMMWTQDEQPSDAIVTDPDASSTGSDDTVAAVAGHDDESASGRTGLATTSGVEATSSTPSSSGTEHEPRATGPNDQDSAPNENPSKPSNPSRPPSNHDVRDPPKTSPNMVLVRKSGRLYAIKRPANADTVSAAQQECSRLKLNRYGNLRGWRVPQESELTQFVSVSRNARVPIVFWLSNGKIWNSKTGNTAKTASKLSNGRVLCVSK